MPHRRTALNIVAGSTTSNDAEPVTLQQFKAYRRVSHNSEDADLQRIIEAARDFCETEILGGIELRKTEYALNMAAFPLADDKIEFPKPPLSSVISVGYFDEGGSTQTYASSNYNTIASDSGPGWIEPIPDELWPATQVRDDAVQINFVAGYSSNTYPPRLRQMVMLVAGDWHANRENQVIGVVTNEIDLGVRRLARSLGWGFYG